MFNLFDVTHGCNTLGEKPRAADDDEVRAYLEWQRQRQGLPDLGAIDIHWRQHGRGAKAHRYCIGATFGGKQGREWENGAYSIVMPGHDMYRQQVTMETLGDGGEVLVQQTLPVEPKKGGVIWSREDVRKAAGKVEKPAKGASIAAPEIITAENCLVEAPQSVPADIPAHDAPIAPIAYERQPDAMPDASAALVARLDALERQVATLSRVVTPIVGKAPRSAAHERAVRRAWAERKARREAEYETRQHDQVSCALSRELADVKRQAEAWRQLAEGETVRANGAVQKRRRAIVNARATLSRSREATRMQRQRAEVLQAQLVALRAAMADPSQPERASDISRLMSERDQARNACAALEQRCSNMQSALEQSAGAIEELASRATRAEAQLRARAA